MGARSFGRAALVLLGLLVGLAVAELWLAAGDRFPDPRGAVVWRHGEDGRVVIELAPLDVNRGPDVHVQVHPRRPPEVRRMGLVGGSTVHGAQVRPFSTIPGFLQPLLQAAVGGRWEVVNLGYPGADAERVAAVSERALELFELDLLVVYSGHNEFLPVYLGHDLARHERPLATALRELCVRWRVGRAVTERLRWRGTVGLEDAYANADVVAERSRVAPVRSAVRADYRRALTRIAAAAARRAVPVVFIVPSSNGVDYGPLATAHSRELEPEQRRRFVGHLRAAGAALVAGELEHADLELGAAAAIDPDVAELLHLRARRLRAAGDIAGARELEHRMWDLDDRPRAAGSSLQAVLREVVTAAGARLIDPSEVLEGPPEPGAPPHFVDHVHPSSYGQYLIAREIALALADASARRRERLPRFEQLAPTLVGRAGLGRSGDMMLARSDINYAWFAFDPEPYVARARQRLAAYGEEELAAGPLAVLDLVLAAFEGDGERMLRRVDQARKSGHMEYRGVLQHIVRQPRMRAKLEGAGVEVRGGELVRTTPVADR